MRKHGRPYWYELMTADPAASSGFYGPVLGWTFRDAGMAEMPYLLAFAGEAMVAGLPTPPEPMPDAWTLYIEVTDCDAAAAQVTALGGQIIAGPDDIPETGRYAICTDPQGAVFGLMQPLPGDTSAAFDQAKTGHGNWHELHSTDPVAGLAFYGALFGWEKSTAMPMGEMGDYQLFRHGGADIGGMMRLIVPADVPPHWLPYFGVGSAGAAKTAIEAAGGTVIHGPAEVPGGAFIVMALDPRGAGFAVVGPA
ncbi:VOC family protein [Neotabrizicola sp. VNH66]|uniref:VOC family protein n=1 Tax=Neotabrizicola sp. VNH66 TaxID=3400918 RepID=UPI003BFC4260